MNTTSYSEVILKIYSHEMTLKTNEYENIYKNRHEAPWSKRLGDSHTLDELNWQKLQGSQYEDNTPTHTHTHNKRYSAIRIIMKWRIEGIKVV